MKYHVVQGGEVVIPKMEGYRLQCCDCGLIHRITFAVVKQGRKLRVAFTASRDQRATVATRRRRARHV